MTISSATRKAGPFFCNGSTDTFPFAYKVFTSADVRVVLTDPSGAESDLVLGTHYTVSLNANQDANPGGSVVTTTAYPGGYLITLTSKLQNLQPVTLTNAGGFYPKVQNDAFDRVTILIQQLAEQVARSVKVSISSSITPDQLVDSINTSASNAAASAAAASTSETNAANYAEAAMSALQLSFKNKIINGDMRIDQRNAGAAVTGITGSVYCLDRFYLAANGPTVSAQQVTDAPAGFTNSAKVTVTTNVPSPTAGQYLTFDHRIEGNNLADMAFGSASAKTFTLSFWVKSSLTGTFPVAFFNNATNRCYVGTYTINSANTWEQKSITVAGDQSGTWTTDKTIGMCVRFGLGAGSTYQGAAGAWGNSLLFATGSTVQLFSTTNATFQITGLQLEQGSSATTFERRQYGTELALCQRYYQVDVNGTFLCSGFAYSATLAVFAYRLATPMRTAPTLGYSAVGDFRVWGSAKQVTVTSLTNSGATTTAMRLDANVASGLVAGEGATLEAYLGAARLTFSAEL